MKKSGFVQWLIQYKGFGATKAENVITRLDCLSDEVCVDNSAVPVFANNKFSAFVKWKMQIGRTKEFTTAERKALDLLGDYLQMIEISQVSYDKGAISKLEIYCKTMKMSYSYKPVLILSIVAAHEKGMSGSYTAVVDEFLQYYSNRLKKGNVAEKKDSIFATEIRNLNSAKSVIENNPVKALQQAGIVRFNASMDYLDVTSAYFFDKEEIEGIRESCYDRLNTYYERLNSTKTTDQTPLEKLRELLEQIESAELRGKCLEVLSECYEVKTGILQNADNGIKSIDLLIEKNDDRKIGKLVRESMESLSQSGFEFDNDLLKKCFSRDWSKTVLGLYYPLFKDYDESIPLEIQTKDYLGNNRYYGKVYIFGTQKVLITCEWYRENKEKFIRWFNQVIGGKDNGKIK